MDPTCWHYISGRLPRLTPANHSVLIYADTSTDFCNKCRKPAAGEVLALWPRLGHNLAHLYSVVMFHHRCSQIVKDTPLAGLRRANCLLICHVERPQWEDYYTLPVVSWDSPYYCFSNLNLSLSASFAWKMDRFGATIY